MTHEPEHQAQPEEESPVELHRERLPDTRRSVTHKFSVSGTEGYLIVGLHDDGRPGELFLKVSKEGSTLGGLMDGIGVLTSLCLQHGVPLETLVEKMSHTRFDPSGHSSNPEMREVSSLLDYIFSVDGEDVCRRLRRLTVAILLRYYSAPTAIFRVLWE